MLYTVSRAVSCDTPAFANVAARRPVGSWCERERRLASRSVLFCGVLCCVALSLWCAACHRFSLCCRCVPSLFAVLCCVPSLFAVLCCAPSLFAVLCCAPSLFAVLPLRAIAFAVLCCRCCVSLASFLRVAECLYLFAAECNLGPGCAGEDCVGCSAHRGGARGGRDACGVKDAARKRSEP